MGVWWSYLLGGPAAAASSEGAATAQCDEKKTGRARLQAGNMQFTKQEKDKFKGLPVYTSPTTCSVEDLTVNVAELLLEEDDEKKEHAEQKLCELLSQRGYCLLSCRGDQQLHACLLELVQKRESFFALEQEQKDSLKVFDEMGVGLNNGYVDVKPRREYLKLRLCDPAEWWPTGMEGFEEAFRASLEAMHQIAWRCFLTVANSQQANGKPLMRSTDIEAVAEFTKEKSSISLIHYYKQGEQHVDEQGKKDESEEEEGKGKHKEAENGDKEEEANGSSKEASDKKEDVCSLHTDTGLLTIGVSSDVPGLQIYDKKEHAWMQVESCCQPLDLVLTFTIIFF
ncbi:hypothetical protein QOT17_019237 [Balamuthia mandrillaris]